MCTTTTERWYACIESNIWYIPSSSRTFSRITDEQKKTNIFAISFGWCERQRERDWMSVRARICRPNIYWENVKRQHFCRNRQKGNERKKMFIWKNGIHCQISYAQRNSTRQTTSTKIQFKNKNVASDEWATARRIERLGWQINDSTAQSTHIHSLSLKLNVRERETRRGESKSRWKGKAISSLKCDNTLICTSRSEKWNFFGLFQPKNDFYSIWARRETSATTNARLSME